MVDTHRGGVWPEGLDANWVGGRDAAAEGAPGACGKNRGFVEVDDRRP